MTYHISRQGQQLGQLTEEDIRSRLQRGELSPADLCWKEGMSNWQPLGQTLPNNQLPSIPTASTSPYAPPSGNLSANAAANPYAPPSANLAMPVNYLGRANLATLGQRFGAFLADLGIMIVACFPLMLAAGMLDQPNDTSKPSTLGLVLIGLGGLILFGLALYNIILLSTKGQTLGKKILGIRIANHENDNNPGFVKAFLLRVFVNALIGFIPLYGLVDICAIFGQERRCIHDLIAGTRVVQC